MPANVTFSGAGRDAQGRYLRIDELCGRASEYRLKISDLERTGSIAANGVLRIAL